MPAPPITIERFAEVRVDGVADQPPGVGIVQIGDIDRRPVLPLPFPFVQQQVPALDVVHAAKLLRVADGPVDGRRRDAERVLDVIEQLERIAARAVELVDEGQDRQPVPAAHLEQLSRLRLDAVRRVDHHDHAVGGNQRAVGVLAEVLVARRVEERHAAALQLELQRGRGDGDAALLLEGHPVGGRVPPRLPAAHGARELDGAGVQQQLLGQRGLSGVGVRDDGERPASRDFVVELGSGQGVGGFHV